MIRIISLTEQGQALALRLHGLLKPNCPELRCDHRPQPFTNIVQAAFKAGDALIMICATGIAVRTLAPVLQDKYRDPPVLVLDEQGQFVIPLLSGHEGGANELANQISQALGAQLVMTTAKPYLQPVYSIGMGCERGCHMEHLHDLLTDCLQQKHLTIADIGSINSIDIKADEVGLIALAKQTQTLYQTFTAEQLAQVSEQLLTPSDYVYQTVGVYGVAESAALYAAQQATGQPAELILSKQKTSKATCAIARTYPPGVSVENVI